MSDLKVTSEITYTLSGLTFKDMELICLGLEDMNDCEFEMVDRKAELLKTIDDILPTNKLAMRCPIETTNRE